MVFSSHNLYPGYLFYKFMRNCDPSKLNTQYMYYLFNAVLNRDQLDKLVIPESNIPSTGDATE